MRQPPGFKRYSGRVFAGWIREGFLPPETLLERPGEIGSLPGAEHLLDCEGRQIHRLPLPFRDGARSCFSYYFTNASWGRAFRHSYAFRTLTMSLRLQEHGFPTLNVVAALKRRREALNWIGLLVAEEVESVSELPSAGQHVFQIHPPINLSEELAGALGRYLASLHAAGFYHGDLKTRHILVADRADGFTFHLVDLEKSLYLPRLLSPLKLILASRDLVQLFASLPGADPKESKADLVLESYLEAARLSSGQRRTLKKLTALYGKHGAFRQGRTLLENLVDLFKRR